MYTTIFFGVAMFTAVVVALVMVILAARSKLVASGNINIEINGEKTIQVPAGGKLLQTLADADLFWQVPVAVAAPARSANAWSLKVAVLYFRQRRAISHVVRRTRAGDCPVKHLLSRISRLRFRKRCLVLNNGNAP